MDFKIIILVMLMACLHGQRTDCNPFLTYRLEIHLLNWLNLTRTFVRGQKFEFKSIIKEYLTKIYGFSKKVEKNEAPKMKRFSYLTRYKGRK